MNAKSMEQITPFVWKIMGLNPSPMTLWGTNTYLIGRKKERILIDTGGGVPGYYENLKKVLSETNSSIYTILITHHHRDHTLGLSDILKENPNINVKKHLIGLEEDDNIEKQFNFKYQNLIENEIFHLKGEENEEDCFIKAIQCPGHTDDHFGFIFLKEKIFFCGDCVLGNGSAVIQDLEEYLKSLEKIKTIKEIENIFSAHGDLILGKENSFNKINEYIEHRLLREQQILNVLKENKSTIQEILEKVYPVNLETVLKDRAKDNINVHLKKLIKNKKVALVDDKFYLI